MWSVLATVAASAIKSQAPPVVWEAMGAVLPQVAAARKLVMAVANDDAELVRRLILDGAPINLSPEYQRPAIFFLRSLQVGEILLEAGADVNCFDSISKTPLYYALLRSLEIAEFLIDNGATVDKVNEMGQGALHVLVQTRESLISSNQFQANALNIAGSRLFRQVQGAGPLNLMVNGDNEDEPDVVCAVVSFLCIIINLLAPADYRKRQFGGMQDALDDQGQRRGSLDLIDKIVTMGANVNSSDVHGRTPLHLACMNELEEEAELLLRRGADVFVEDTNGNQALHIVLKKIYEEAHLTMKNHRLVQLLVSHGSVFDAECEKLLAACKPGFLRQFLQPVNPEEAVSRFNDVALAVQLWIRVLAVEHENNLPSTEVPAEIVNQGLQALKIYLIQLAVSKNAVFRRKMCLVGVSSAGKTSLAKSITSERPSLEHADVRTMGIDKFELLLEVDSVKHLVQFWDFAGHDEYQVAHALFFSARTIYLMCVDLAAYAAAYLQARTMACGDAAAFDERMNAHVENCILSWKRLILARQPDAEFRFVGTKHDVMYGVDDRVLEDLRSRLRNVLVIVRNLKLPKIEAETRDTPDGRDEESRITHLGHPELALIEDKPEADLTLTSCIDQDSVTRAQQWIQELVITTPGSYRMPDSYLEALRIIEDLRVQAAHSDDPRTRIRACFTDVNDLVRLLVLRVQGIDDVICRITLQALRDTGDVLWFDDLDDSMLQNMVFTDPLLLIDLIRQVFNHERGEEVMDHATLRGLPLWRSLDEGQMLATKLLLHHFHLAFPTDKHTRMEWDSDLMLPAFWRSKRSAQARFMGQPLKYPSGVLWNVNVHFEIYVESAFALAPFDHLVSGSYNSAFTRHVGPDYILYGDPTGQRVRYACRLVVDWDSTTYKRVLHLEAVLLAPEAAGSSPNSAADDPQAAELWARFEWLCAALDVVFKKFPGLLISSSARVDGPEGFKRNLRTCTSPEATWLPPEPTLTKCRQFLLRQSRETVERPQATAEMLREASSDMTSFIERFVASRLANTPPDQPESAEAEAEAAHGVAFSHDEILWADQLTAIRNIVPDVTTAMAVEALERHAGDVDAVANELFALGLSP